MFGLDEDDLYRVDGPVNLNRLMAVYEPAQRPDLKYPPFTPSVPRDIADADNILAAIRRRDILLHHPYESFAPVLDFISRSAQDPDVLSDQADAVPRPATSRRSSTAWWRPPRPARKSP